ncbi:MULTISPECIES: hypothetical protein [Bifidobacterium]|jgi:hypothetical protein|uniref:hypothetical protein n=1 Tax=Bifidobacterium TaxID=1678 RepID=UPI001C390B17|nr:MULTISPECIES: hypothetical protein [Bifidobacterium]MBV3807436.1 hypothetical protein [Bifidobacterium adolescentis]MBV3836080.1 hypothetical protein [Bifidobacterium sp. MSK.17.10]MCG4567250.1 hypothetical protein [Bifidobacterium adolescentis]
MSDVKKNSEYEIENYDEHVNAVGDSSAPVSLLLGIGVGGFDEKDYRDYLEEKNTR